MAISIVEMVQILGLVVVFGVVCLFFIFIKAFNVKCVIYEQGAMGSMKLVNKRAKKKQALDGNNSLQFMLSKEKMPLPPADFFFSINKGVYHLNLYRDKNGQLHPVKVRVDTDNKLHLVPDDRDVRAWYVNEQAKINAAYNKPSTLQQLLPVIVIGGSLAFAVAVIVISGHYYTESMSRLAGTVGGQLGEVSQALKTLPTMVPPPTP